MKRRTAAVILGIFLVNMTFSLFTPVLIVDAFSIPGVPSIPGISGGKNNVPVNVSDNTYQKKENAKIAFLRGLAMTAVERFTNEFIDKLVYKYKIRNYLYYDQVLTNYYLNNYIRDKIKDPDLQQIYTMMESAYITGQSTGNSNAPDPRKALIPKLKLKISKMYEESGGIKESAIKTPSSGMSDVDYFSAAQSWTINNPSYVESNLHADFGAFQSSATTAAQLEVLVGQGLKSGRFIGGTCSNSSAKDPAACTKAGGTWNASALDKTRSFIDNPSVFIQNYLNAAIDKKYQTRFDPNNFWFALGGMVGKYLLNQLDLKKSSGVLNEAGSNYAYSVPSDDVEVEPGAEIDIDNDNIADGVDIDADEVIDFCYFGGTPPDQCVGSTESMQDGESTGAEFVNCDEPPDTISPDPMSMMQLVKSEFPDLDLINEAPGGGRDQFTAIVAWRLNQTDSNWGRKRAGGPQSTDTLGYLRPDMGAGRFEAVDLLGGGTGALQRGCYGVVGADQTWIPPVSAP